PIGFKRVEKPAFGEQEVAKLELDFRGLRGRRRVRPNDEGGCDDENGCRDDSEGALHEASRKTSWALQNSRRTGSPGTMTVLCRRTYGNGKFSACIVRLEPRRTSGPRAGSASRGCSCQARSPRS